MKRILALLLCVMISTVALGGDSGYRVSYDGGSVQGIKTGASPASAVADMTYGQDVHRRVGAAIGLAVVTSDNWSTNG